MVNMGTVEIKRNQTTSLPRSVHGVGPVGAMGRVLPRPITRGAPPVAWAPVGELDFATSLDTIDLEQHR